MNFANLPVQNYAVLGDAIALITELNQILLKMRANICMHNLTLQFELYSTHAHTRIAIGYLVVCNRSSS